MARSGRCSCRGAERPPLGAASIARAARALLHPSPPEGRSRAAASCRQPLHLQPTLASLPQRALPAPIFSPSSEPHAAAGLRSPPRARVAPAWRFRVYCEGTELGMHGEQRGQPPAPLQPAVPGGAQLGEAAGGCGSRAGNRIPSRS